MVNAERVDWLQNITSPLLFKHKVQMGCTHVKKNKGMCSVLKNSSDASFETDHTVQKERHHQEKLYVAGSFKFTQRSYAPEK
ncbi:hypothetical protein YC2023_092171 [Brassica napus]